MLTASNKKMPSPSRSGQNDYLPLTFPLWTPCTALPKGMLSVSVRKNADSADETSNAPDGLKIIRKK